MPSDCESSFRYLPLSGNLAVAVECCHHAFVPHVLAPGLEFLWGATEPLAEAGQGRTEAVWVCVGNTSSLEGFPEYRPYWPSIAPVRPGYARRLKLMPFAERDARSGEK